MHKKSTILILFFSIVTHSLHGMEADLAGSQVSSLDLLPNEITDFIVYRMVPSTVQLDSVVNYESVKSMVNFLSTSHKYRAFEATAIKALKERYTVGYLSRTLLPYAINRHDFRVAKILIDAGGLLDPDKFIAKLNEKIFEPEGVSRLKLYAQLLAVSHKKSQIIDEEMLGEYSPFEKLLCARNYNSNRFVSDDRKKLNEPISLFIHSGKIDEMAVMREFKDLMPRGFESIPQKSKGRLLFLIPTNNPTALNVILRFEEPPREVFKESEELSKGLPGHLAYLGNWTTLKQLFEKGDEIISAHLRQKYSNGRTAKDLTIDLIARSLIAQYASQYAGKQELLTNKVV